MQFFSVVNENVSLVISRQILTDVSTQLTVLSDPVSKAVSHYTLEKVITLRCWKSFVHNRNVVAECTI